MTVHKPFFVNVFGGAVIDVADPRFDQFSPIHMFEQMSKNNRWGGNLDQSFCLLQHSLLVAELIEAKEHKIYGLFHDAPELITGDILGPAKDYFDWLSDGKIKQHEHFMFDRLCDALDIERPNAEIKNIVHVADMRARATEKRDVVNNKNGIVIPFEPSAFPTKRVPAGELLIQAHAYFHTYMDWYNRAKAA